MRHIYSVARFVPDATRGEFINIGILAGSEETNEWVLQTVSRDTRASRLDDSNYLPEARRQLAVISTKLDRFTDSLGAMLAPDDLPGISEEWVARLASDYGNMLQFTQPHAAIGTSAQDVIDKLWPLLIAEPDATTPKGRTKNTALGVVRSALKRHMVTSNQWQQAVRLQTNNSHARVDFAIHNGKVVQLTQCWSFQINDQDSLLADIKAWAWTIRDLRRSGGKVIGNSTALVVEPRTDVAAVFVPPSDLRSPTFAEAQTVFADNEVDATSLPVERADEIGIIAARSLGLNA